MKSKIACAAVLFMLGALSFQLARAQQTTQQPAGAVPQAEGAEQAEQPEATAGPGRGVDLPDAQLRLRVPADYWEQYTAEEIAEQTGGGCRPARPTPHLLLVLRHRDAIAEVWVTRSPNTFLLRDREDLERYVGGFTGAIKEQLGESLSDFSAEYSERGGMIVHRVSFTTIARGGGGCAPAGGDARVQRPHILIADYYVRPQGRDARYFRVSCRAPDEAFEKLRPEFEFILSSVEFTGEPAGEFFAPDAPEEKVPTAEDAAEGVSGGGQWGWIAAAAMVVAIWFLMRRKGKSRFGEPEE